jgi:glycosyltransferase involved in cell wall biosynthesis
MRIEVVIPTLNRSEILVHSVQSVLNQNYKDFRLTVVDNASSDDTAKEMLQISDPRFRYVRFEKQLDAAANWDRAIGLVNGDFNLVLGDDDALLPTALSDIAAKVEEDDETDIVLLRPAHYLLYDQKNHYEDLLIIPKQHSTTAINSSNIVKAYLSLFSINPDGIYLHPSMFAFSKFVRESCENAYGPIYAGLFPDWNAHPLLASRARKVKQVLNVNVVIGGIDQKVYCKSNSKLEYFRAQADSKEQELYNTSCKLQKLYSDISNLPFMISSALYQELCVYHKLKDSTDERIKECLSEVNLNEDFIIRHVLKTIQENYEFCLEKFGDCEKIQNVLLQNYEPKKYKYNIKLFLRRILFALPKSVRKYVFILKNTTSDTTWLSVPRKDLTSAVEALIPKNAPKK